MTGKNIKFALTYSTDGQWCLVWESVENWTRFSGTRLYIDRYVGNNSCNALIHTIHNSAMILIHIWQMLRRLFQLSHISEIQWFCTQHYQYRALFVLYIIALTWLPMHPMLPEVAHSLMRYNLMCYTNVYYIVLLKLRFGRCFVAYPKVLK